MASGITIPKVDIKFPDDYSAYEARYNGRDLFFVNPLEPLPGNTGVSAFSLDGFPANVRVLALMLGKPARVVLEDAAASKTYFLTEGQDSDGITLSRLDRNTVVVDYRGQKVPVSLKQPLK